MQQIHILVGSETGSASTLAKTIKQALIKNALQVKIHNKPSLSTVQQLPKQDVLLMCISTCGDGELPDNIKPFYDGLIAQVNCLKNKRYGLICLGDSSFKTFAGAGKLMDAALQTSAAKPIGKPLNIDGFLPLSAKQQTRPWLEQWIKQL